MIDGSRAGTTGYFYHLFITRPSNPPFYRLLFAAPLGGKQRALCNWSEKMKKKKIMGALRQHFSLKDIKYVNRQMVPKKYYVHLQVKLAKVGDAKAIVQSETMNH